jgi:hypothetical protein
MTAQAIPPAPVLKANDDDGGGFHAVFSNLDGSDFLEAYGVDVSEERHIGFLITLRSAYEDAEGDYIYLLVAEFHGAVEWIGYPMLNGVLTKFLWRTEEQAKAENEAARGDGAYRPKGPMSNKDRQEWSGDQIQAIRCMIRLKPRSVGGGA